LEKKNYGIKRCNVRLGLKAACFYFAFKKTDFPREKKEIADLMGYDIKIVTKGCNAFLDIMGGEYVKMNPFHATDFIKRFSLVMNLSHEDQERLWKIVEFISQKTEFIDISPANITSGCIYFISLHSKLGINKKMIHQKCGTSQTVISKTFLNINNYKDEINILLL
jgi:transcription initiation factor TFIIIB Brf1 subunit/transcription initiation factor TFIIB